MLRVPPYQGSHLAANPFNVDAQAFFDKQSALGQTLSGTEKSAVNQLVLDAKTNSIWTTQIGLYPLVGGTAVSCSVNLKNPSAFQITWNGSVTFASNGITGNGTNGYGDTGINGLTNTTINSLAFGVYSRTNIAETAKDIGTMGTAENNCGIFLQYTDNNAYFDNDEQLGRCSGSSTNSSGMFVSSRTGATAHSGYRNGSSIASTSSAQGVVNGTNFGVLIGGTGGGNTFSSKNLALAFVADGLTPTQIANFYTIVQAFQTALGRQV